MWAGMFALVKLFICYLGLRFKNVLLYFLSGSREMTDFPCV